MGRLWARRWGTNLDVESVGEKKGEGLEYTFRTGFLHGGGCVFECEEGGHGVCGEGGEEVVWAGGGDAGGAEEAGGGGPDVEAAPGVEDVVDEAEGVFFRGDFVRVADDFCVWVLGVYGVCEFGVGFGGEVRAGVYACCAVGWVCGVSGWSSYSWDELRIILSLETMGKNAARRCCERRDVVLTS